MFGMGFMEILLIAVIAIIALGPEKLPTAMVEIAKFLKKFKSGVEDAKSTIDNELNISDMKAEANKFKAQIEDAKSSISINNLSGIIDDDDLNIQKDIKAPLNDIKEEVKEIKEEVKTLDASDKFKVNTNKEEN